MADMKKDLQKAIKAFRDAQDTPSEYPKAIMTAQQVCKGTATINCGLAEKGKNRAPQVVAFAPFVDWYMTYGIKAIEVEVVESAYRLPQYQIRLTY